MADGRIDGHFVIKQGGITQGIAQELGLNSAECKQMGSIWNEVMNELNNPNNYTIENNGNNKNNQNKNLTVQAGAVVKFTQDCWQRIVKLVNDTLHKNIETAAPNTAENNTEVGNNLIERFNAEYPNAESSTYCGKYADYLEAHGGDKEEIARLRARASELEIITTQENNDNVKTEDRQVKECRHRAEIMTKYLQEQGINDVKEIMICTKEINFSKGEHVFNVIGLAENADTKDPRTWGEDAVVIDAWSGKVFTPQEALEFFKDFFDYDSVDDIQTGTLEDIQQLHREKYTPASYEDIPKQDQFNTRDARGLYLDTLDLTPEQLLDLTIDDTTILSEEQAAIIEKAKTNGMNAGLNINSLHEQGITGKGVRIAIIDSAITDNPEFSDNILYNRNFAANVETSAYHGNAISSVAVGKDCGVAPDAELAFYSANTCSEQTKAIENVIIQNEEYKKNGEPLISVISISCGFDTCDDYEQNYGALREMIAKAKEAGIAVITCDDKEEYQHFAGADRNPQANPDEVSSYRADRFHRDGEWWNDRPDEVKDQTIFIPAEHRTVADDYDGLRYEGAFGGASWTAPYIAGVFALAKQVKPDVTYEQFMEVVQKTADKMHNYDDGQYVGKLINPQGIINELLEQ
jgi:hypothetical protein